MLRFVNVCLVLCLVALAYVIYEVKYESRALDAEIAALQKDIEVERDAVAVLRTEWSLLNRPERIERLAEKYLKLAPAKPNQLVTLDTLKDSDFELARLSGEGEKQKAPIAGEPKTAAAKPAPAKPSPSWTTTTVAAETARPRVKAPILATTALPPVSVSMPGE
jgi:cell division protein FtsL